MVERTFPYVNDNESKDFVSFGADNSNNIQFETVIRDGIAWVNMRVIHPTGFVSLYEKDVDDLITALQYYKMTYMNKDKD